MEATTRKQTIPSFQEFKQESENKTNCLFADIFRPILEEEQATYNSNLTAIYSVNLLETYHLPLNSELENAMNFNVVGLDDNVRTNLFTQLIKSLQNPFTAETRAFRHIVRFQKASLLNLDKIKEVFRGLNTELNTPDNKLVYISMAKVHLGLRAPDTKSLKEVVEFCSANHRREELKIINSISGRFNHISQQCDCKQIATDFQLNDRELGEMAKHIIKADSGFRDLFPLIKDGNVRFEIAKFAARNLPEGLDTVFLKSLQLSKQQIFELFKISLSIHKAESILFSISWMCDDKEFLAEYVDLEQLINLIQHEIKKDPDCLQDWTCWDILPTELTLLYAKKGYPNPYEVIRAKTPKEVLNVEFTAPAFVENQSLEIPSELKNNDQIQAIKKIRAAKKNPDTLTYQEVLETTKITPEIYLILPQKFRNDPQIAQLALPLAIKGDVNLWKVLPLEIRNIKEHALQAMQNNLKIFEELSDELKNNNEILELLKTKILQGNLNIREIVPPQILMDRNIALMLLKNDASFYSKLPDSFRKDSEFIQIVLEKVMEGDPDTWLLLPQEEQLKNENICQVLKKYPEFYISAAMPFSKLSQREVLRTLFYTSPQVVEEFMDHEKFKWVKAAVIYAMAVFQSDGLLKVSDKALANSRAKKIFDISHRLPQELQAVFSHIVAGSTEQTIPWHDLEWAARYLNWKFQI